MGFSRQAYWRGLPCPPPGHLPDPGMEPTSLTSPALAGGFFTTSTTVSPILLAKDHPETNPMTIKPETQATWQSSSPGFSYPPANAGKSHGWRSLVGCSPWGRSESDMTERLHFHFSLSCIGEGNGNPLQGSCLENPRDGGTWWAAVYGVAQRRTRLKRLSSQCRRPKTRGFDPWVGKMPWRRAWQPIPVFLP